MRIKRLDISGFKSFMDRSVFAFEGGITGIVGPNGCGKSNVVDAIRWSMGEQSAKHLRGRSMEDVVFSGSESKPALGMAEVTITFYNDTPHLLPMQYQGFSEISVTRRLFRNTESEYFINKTPCRLLDVTELFLGSGVGTKAYSIIEQGRIGLIVSAKPEDRRALIEEAAGITRYKSRRKAAERKMEYTEQNLLRVSDLTAELGRRLGVLERQARKAERYRELKSQMREIELHGASLHFLELTVLGNAARRTIEGLTSEERALAEKAVAFDVAIEALRAKVGLDERALAGLNERAHQVDNDLKVGAANLEAYRREIEAAARRLAEADREIAEIAGGRAELVTEREALVAQRSSLDGLATGDEQHLLEVREELSSLSRQEEAAVQKLDQERALLVSALSRMATGKSRLENLGRQKSDLQERLARARGERSTVEERALALERERVAQVEKLGASRQMKLALEQRRAGEEEALERSRRELMENEARLIAAREELGDRRSRLESLKEIERNYEGYGRGVRAVMALTGESAREKGVLGLVSDVVRAPAEYEKAIEAVLAERLQTVVVANQETALTLTTYLKDSREGRGSFLPLTLTSTVAKATADMSVAGVLGSALDLVSFEPELTPLVQHLLGNVVVVRDLSSAVAYSAAGHAHTVVTLDGEVIEPCGGVVGGVLEGAGVGALQKKREIIELEQKLARAESEYQIHHEQHRRLSERIHQIDEALQGLSRETHSEDLSVVGQEKDLHKANEDLSQTRERLERLSTDVDAMQRSLSEILAEETAAAGSSAQAEAEGESRETRVRELSEQLATVRARLAELNAERTNLQVKVAAEFERREAMEKSLARVVAALGELGEREARLKEAKSEAEERGRLLEEKVGATLAQAEDLRVQLAALTADRDAARAACEKQEEQLRQDESEMRALRKKLEELQSGLSARALEQREHALELEHLCGNVRDRYGVELAEELTRFHLLPPPAAEAERKLKDLREQVERMGEVNLTAIEEHAELSQRHEFLSNQKKDLEQSLAQLRRAIVRINKTSKERFQQTFDIVNEKFQQVFPRLFSGGRAGLVLVESEDGGDPGIEIMAQPPGKKLQSVNLLSGGEKALTAVSLIFAIFLIKPTPFCLLDEVDAPLDDANVDRYNDLVREMSKISQFILITHNKRTMQISDTLYGVTMEEPGISKVVSVKMSEKAEESSPAEQVPAAG